MILKEKLTKVYTDFCKSFSSSVTEKKNGYDKIIYSKFGVNRQQQKKGAIFITLVYLIIVSILYKLLKFKLSYCLLLLFFALYIFIILSNYHEKLIKSKEKSLINYFQLLSILITIFFKDLKKEEEKNIIIFDLLIKKPEIACNFKKIYKKISFGGKFKKNFKNLVFYSPNFNNYFQNLLKYNYKMSLIEYTNSFNSYYENQSEIFIKSLDTKLNLFFFFSVFYPIGFFYIYSSNSLSLDIIVISLLIFYFIQMIFINNILNENNYLIGGYSKDRTKINTLNSFLNFFYQLSFNLIEYPPELSTIYAIKNLSEKDKEVLNINKCFRYYKFLSLTQFLKDFFNGINNNDIKIFLIFFLKIFNTNSIEGVKFFQETSKIIKNHKELSQKQEIIFKSSNIKVKSYKILLSLILGILTPFIYRIQKIFSFFSFDTITENINKQIIIFNSFSVIELIFYAFIALYFLFLTILSFNKVFNFQKFKKFDGFIIFFFIIVLFLSNFLWNLLIYI